MLRGTQFMHSNAASSLLRLTSLFLLCAALSYAAEAQAQDPSLTRAQNAYQEIQKSQGKILAMGPATELDIYRKHLNPSHELPLVEETLKRQVHPLVRASLEFRRAQILLNQGKKEAAREIVQNLGFVTRWQTIGPFPYDPSSGIDAEYAPEIDPSPDSTHRGIHGNIPWRNMGKRDHLGRVDLESMIRPATGAVAYAATSIQTRMDRDLIFRVGSDSPYQLWINGELVHSAPTDLGGSFDRDAIPLKLPKGKHHILLKLANESHELAFHLRITDKQGAPLRNIRASPASKDLLEALKNEEKPTPQPATSALDNYLKQARQIRQDEDKARALAHGALLSKTLRPRDPEEPHIDLAREAQDLSSSPEVLLLLTRAHDTQWRKVNAIESAWTQARKDPWIRYQRALLYKESAGDAHIVDAHKILDELLQEHPDFVAAHLLSIQLQEEEGMTLTASQRAQKLAQKHPTHPGALRKAAFSASESMALPQQRKLCDALHNLAAAEINPATTCLALLIKRREFNTARAWIDELLALRPDITGLHGLRADLEIAAGKPQDATQHFKTLAETLPGDASAWNRLGNHLVEYGDKEKGIAHLKHSLKVEPQNVFLKDYLNRLAPSEPTLEESYALDIPLVSPEEEIARYGSEDYYYLLDQQVTRVLPNGLSSRFVQQAIRVRTDNGLSSMRNFQITYTPGEEDLEILKVHVTREDGTTRELYSSFEQSLSEPWYNLYYDYRAQVLSFPDLNRGDTVEIQYRISQTSTSNALGDYFGDIWFAEDTASKVQARYVLLTPPEKKIFHHGPGDTAHNYTEKTIQTGEETLTERSWAFDKIPRLKPENQQPGFAELADYLHLSTYSSWEEIAKWYWNLVEDQLIVDSTIRNIVKDLTQNLTEPRDKVRAIHNYVVKNTRYVGLEFGIHGFKPYRTTLCLRRRFGDCKDKASLLKVMLEEAGIDADLALVRTRPNGAIAGNPASLQIFDHAITYVPAFDLFLDGTAEYSGTDELPWGDQGIQALIVKRGGSHIYRKTPVFPAKTNAILTSMEVDLTGEKPVADVRSTVTGAFASYYRRNYEAQEQRQEIFERSLSQDFPGAEVSYLEFSDLTQLEEDISFSYRFQAEKLVDKDVDKIEVRPSLRDPNLSQRLTPWTRREQPLELGHPFLSQETYRIRLPRNAKLEKRPPEINLTSPFGAFSWVAEETPQTDKDGPVLEIRLNLRMDAYRVSPEDYLALRTWIQSVEQALETTLVYTRH